MSRKMKIDIGFIEAAKAAFAAALEKTSKDAKFDGKVKFDFDFAKVEEKAILYFTETAWMKMQYLIAVFGSECAWHGVVERHGEDKSEFIVKDILVYPQQVTGATVTTDQKEYEDWMNDLDDETFNALKFHGHSHVNMGVTPSSVDNEHQRGIVSQLNDSQFYIFGIFNKSGNRWLKIFDMKRNIVFEKDDIEVKILMDGSRCFDLMEEADEKITTKTAVYTAGSYGYGNYGGYQGSAATSTAASKGASTSSKISQTTTKKQGKQTTYTREEDDDWRKRCGLCGWYED